MSAVQSNAEHSKTVVFVGWSQMCLSTLIRANMTDWANALRAFTVQQKNKGYADKSSLEKLSLNNKPNKTTAIQN